jgi:hypothetical protein
VAVRAFRPCILFAMAALAYAFAAAVPALAQETPYFVAYSHDLEEPGDLEIAMKGVQASPKYGNPFVSGTLEMEYGLMGWWTTEVYLSGQHTSQDSTIFTGWRFENRFRPLLTEHFINPVLYVEFEDTNFADRSFLEVEGHQTISDLLLPNAVASQEREREIETKLILSSNTHGWNFSENFIAAKEISNEPWEFGYALGTSRPLSLTGSARACVFCRQNFDAGAELYGGLGDLNSFGLQATSHYLGPIIAFDIPRGPTLTFSPSFGLNDNSVHVLYRFKVSYELEQVFGHLHHDRDDVR